MPQSILIKHDSFLEDPIGIVVCRLSCCYTIKKNYELPPPLLCHEMVGVLLECDCGTWSNDAIATIELLYNDWWYHKQAQETTLRGLELTLDMLDGAETTNTTNNSLSREKIHFTPLLSHFVEFVPLRFALWLFISDHGSWWWVNTCSYPHVVVAIRTTNLITSF